MICRRKDFGFFEGGNKMEIENMNTDEIREFLKGREEKTWQDAIIEMYGFAKPNFDKKTWDELEIYKHLPAGDVNAKLLKAIVKYDGYFWFNPNDYESRTCGGRFTIVIKNSVSYDEMKEDLK